jgi:hypothetical protein
MNSNPENLSTSFLSQLKRTYDLLSRTASAPKKFKIVKTAPERSSEIHRRKMTIQSRTRRNQDSKPPDLEMRYKGQLENPSFFYKFSESFNLLERFIKAQSANDLVIALCNLGENLNANFQKERSIGMLKHLKSSEGQVFLKHKINSIIDDTTQQILRDPRLNSSNSGNKGNSTDDDLTKSEGNISTQNESNNQAAETNPRDYVNSTDQKVASIIALFDSFIASGLKHSARELLLGMDEKFSEKLELNPLVLINNERPFMIIDTVQDPKKSGIETNNLIDYSNWDSSGNQVINVPATLKSFTNNYIRTKKINPKPVDQAIQPYLNKVIKELNYQHLYSDSATRFYLKAIQKGYVEEANELLTTAIQNRFKAFSSSDVFLQYHADKGEFDEFIDLLKWAVDKKFLPEKNLKKIVLSLITETDKLKDDPKKLTELSTKYKLLETLLDKLQKLYHGKNTVDDLMISNTDEIIKRFHNQQHKLERSLNILELLERSFKVDPSQVANYQKLPEDEKGASERAPEITQASLSSKPNSHNEVEPSKEDVLQALKKIYIKFELNSFDEQENNLDENPYDEDEDYDEDDENGNFTTENYYEEDYANSPINFLKEIPSLFEQINEVLNASLDQEKIKAMGIDLAQITSTDLEIQSISSVLNESFTDFKAAYLKTSSDDQHVDLSDDTNFDRFNNILLKKLTAVHEQDPNSLRFLLGTLLNAFVKLEDDLTKQVVNIIDSFRYPEIFVNKETFYKNAPNRETDGSFKLIDDEKSRQAMINKLIEFFDREKTLETTKELSPDSKIILTEIIDNFDSEDYSTTATDRITFLYFSLLESNLKQEANIILHNSILDTLSKNSEINHQRLVSLLPVLKYAKENGYLENFKNAQQEINFNKFDELLNYSLDNVTTQRYSQQDYLDKIENPKISHQEILLSLKLLHSNKKLNHDLENPYQKSLLKRLSPDEKLMNSPLYLENNLPDLIRLAVAGKNLKLLNKENLKTFKRHFQAEDLVRLTPTELVKDFFKNSPNLREKLELSILESFRRIRNLESSTRFVNDLESLVDKAFLLDNERLTQKLTVKLREEIPSLEINSNNAAAHLSLLNCIFHGIHDFENSDDNERLKAEYSEYLDLPLGLKENLDDPVDLRIMLITKMEEALQSFEKFLKQNKTLKKDDFPQSYESKGILEAIGLPLLTLD